MESLPEPKTTPTDEKLSGSAIDNTREQKQDTIQSWNRKKETKNRGTASPQEPEK
jgi:DNA-nicking Smr family endonuclease